MDMQEVKDLVERTLELCGKVQHEFRLRLESDPVQHAMSARICAEEVEDCETEADMVSNFDCIIVSLKGVESFFKHLDTCSGKSVFRKAKDIRECFEVLRFEHLCNVDHSTISCIGTD